MVYCNAGVGRSPSVVVAYLEAVTSNFIYIRLHGSRKLYVSEYSENEINNWAEKIKKWDVDTYVYFDNDAMGHAPKNALKIKELLNL